VPGFENGEGSRKYVTGLEHGIGQGIYRLSISHNLTFRQSSLIHTRGRCLMWPIIPSTKHAATATGAARTAPASSLLATFDVLATEPSPLL
jgi:hypothetical protein